MLAKSIFNPICRSPFDRIFDQISTAGVSPLSLFAAGEQGVWYDPSDTTTLFQDSAGTTPVTASGQPVGLMLDKSGRGHHATQPTAGYRPIYRRGDSRGVVNLLTRSEAFDNVAWGKLNVTCEQVLVSCPDGSGAAYRLKSSANSSNVKALRSHSSLVAGTTYITSFVVKKSSDHAYVGVRLNSGTITRFNISTGVVEVLGEATSAGVISLGGGWQVVWAARVSSGVAGYASIYPCSSIATSEAHATTGEEECYIWGAQLNLGPTALPYQRNDSHLGGVATGASTDLHWLETDGVDDGMATGNIDFTGTDKVAVFAGVRKLSDAATGVLAGLSASADASHPSTFALLAPSSGGSSKYNFRSFGTTGDGVGTRSIATPVAPSSNVLTGVGGISTDTCRLRVDGAQVAQTTVDQGTGNFGNYPLYLFRLSRVALPFNGWFYGLAITGRLTTDAETVATERFLGKKTAVVIP